MTTTQKMRVFKAKKKMNVVMKVKINKFNKINNHHIKPAEAASAVNLKVKVLVKATVNKVNPSTSIYLKYLIKK